jgi:hypothetical protein
MSDLAVSYSQNPPRLPRGSLGFNLTNQGQNPNKSSERSIRIAGILPASREARNVVPHLHAAYSLFLAMPLSFTTFLNACVLMLPVF